MNIFISFIIGYIVSEIVAGRKSIGRKQVIKSLRFNYKGGILHIHHWTWCLSLMILLYIAGYQMTVLFGFLAGCFVQGLTYKDYLKFFYTQ